MLHTTSSIPPSWVAEVGTALKEVAVWVAGDPMEENTARQAESLEQTLHPVPINPEVHWFPHPRLPLLPAATVSNNGLSAGGSRGFPHDNCEQFAPPNEGGHEHEFPD